MVVVTGPVLGAEVGAYSLDTKTGATTLIASSAPTDEKGQFHIELGAFSGPLMLIARGPNATYTEPAAGVSVAWDAATELRGVYVERPSVAAGLVIDFPLAKAATGVVVSPWSELAVTEGYGLAAASGGDVGEGLVKAYTLFNTHLLLDFWAVVPTDLTQQGGGWNDSIQHGAELAGMSSMVVRLAQDSQSSGAGLTSLQLLALLRRDLKDLKLDGKEKSTDVKPTIAYGTCDTCLLSPCTASAVLAEGIGDFLISDKNTSGIDVADAAQLRAHLSAPHLTNAAELFGDTRACKVDTRAPDVFLEEVLPSGDAVNLQPAAILTGTRHLRVRAVDSSDIDTVTIEFFHDAAPFHPQGFAEIHETSPNVQTLVEDITLHTDIASDGLYEIRVTAKDASGNPSDENMGKRTVVFDNTDAGNISGTVTVGGRVDNARVRVFRYDNGVVGDTPLAEGHTTNEGIYTLTIPDNPAQTLLVVADADPLGTTKYTEAVSGDPVTFSSQDSLELILDDWHNGQSRLAQVTPWTHIGASLARAVWEAKGSVPALWAVSVANAYAMLEQHFADGGASIVLRDVVPDDLTTGGMRTITDNVRYGLMVTALSRIAEKHALQTGATSASMNTLTLTKKLAEDASVCALVSGTRECLDGRSSGQIVHGIVPITSYVTRDQLAIAAVDFLGTPRNHTGLGELDFAALFEVLGADTGDRGTDLPRLYPAADPPQFYDQIDPTVAFEAPSPANGAVLRGTVSLQARARDNRALLSVEFTGSAAVLPRISNSAIDTTNGTGATVRPGPWVRTGTLNAEALADGTYSVEVTATDEAHRPKLATLQLVVDKTKPTVSITGATAGGQPLANGGVTGASSATITGTVTDAHLASARYVLNGGAPVTLTLGAGGAFSVNVALAPDNNTFTVTGIDAAGNPESASASYIRDASPPTTGLVTATINAIETASLPPASTAPSTIGLATYSTSGAQTPIIDGAVVHKYASNFGPNSSNLPEWHFIVTDNRSSKPNITLKGRLSRDGQGVLTDWFTIPAAAAGTGFDRVLVVSSAIHADIALVNDRFTLEYQAVDQFGNASAIASVHWTEDLKAPPLRQSVDNEVMCDSQYPAPNPQSCADVYRLGGPLASVNGHVLLQGGAALPEGRVYIAKGLLENPNDVPVRVRFTPTTTGTYGYWIKYTPVTVSNGSGAPDNCSTENFVRDHNLDGSCLSGTSPGEDRRTGLPIASSFPKDVQVVVDGGGVLSTCGFCDANEREIPARSRVYVYVRSTPWSMLWPRPGTLAPVNPGDSEGGAEGVGGANQWHCAVRVHHGDAELCNQWVIAKPTQFLEAAKVTPSTTVTVDAKPASLEQSYDGVAAEGVGTSALPYYGRSWCSRRYTTAPNPDLFPCN